MRCSDLPSRKAGSGTASAVAGPAVSSVTGIAASASAVAAMIAPAAAPAPSKATRNWRLCMSNSLPSERSIEQAAEGNAAYPEFFRNSGGKSRPPLFVET